jgi:hypothetical protein
MAVSRRPVRESRSFRMTLLLVHPKDVSSQVGRKVRWMKTQLIISGLCSKVQGSDSGFSTYPAVQLRKCRPTPSFTPRQTLMPKFDQSPFYVNNSGGHREPISYIAGLWCCRSRGALPRYVTIFLGVEAGAEIGLEAAGSLCPEGTSCRGVSILALELKLSPITLAIVAGLAFTKKSRPACIAFDSCSSTASMRAARTNAPRTPVASHAVSRLNLLIMSPVNGHFLVLGCFGTWAWFLHSGNTPRKRVGAYKCLVTPNMDALNAELLGGAPFPMSNATRQTE